MSRSIWLLLPYAIAIAGYAGWCGRDVWNGWVIWVLALAPLALAVYVFVHTWRYQRSVRTALPVTVLNLLLCAWIALCGLGIAWVFADTAKLWTSPALRVGISAGVTAIVVAFAIFANEKRKSKLGANPSEPDPSELPP